jgi:hypothetical protein
LGIVFGTTEPKPPYWGAFICQGDPGPLPGDLEGAIEYFEFYLTQNDDPQREDWTAELEVGRNPFDEVTLEELRNE